VHVSYVDLRYASVDQSPAPLGWWFRLLPWLLWWRGGQARRVRGALGEALVRAGAAAVLACDALEPDQLLDAEVLLFGNGRDELEGSLQPLGARAVEVVELPMDAAAQPRELRELPRLCDSNLLQSEDEGDVVDHSFSRGSIDVYVFLFPQTSEEHLPEGSLHVGLLLVKLADKDLQHVPARGLSEDGQGEVGGVVDVKLRVGG